MADAFDFELTYWGTTGTFTRSLQPVEVTDKIIESIRCLRSSGQLSKLENASDDQLQQVLQSEVPFWTRSTYGGNTTCIQVQTPDALIVVDAGSGLRELGAQLNRLWNDPTFERSRSAQVLISHAHMDHIFATAFAEPFYDENNHVRVLAPQHVIDSLTAVFGADSDLRSVLVPVNFEQMSGIKEILPVTIGEEFSIESTRVQTCALNHPGECVGYRLDRGSRRIAFTSDHELTSVPDSLLVDFVRDADLWYADAQYLYAEYVGEEGVCGERPQSRVGWGHGTVEGVIDTAIAAGVKQIHLGHHDPKRSDRELSALEHFAQQRLQEGLKRSNRAVNSCHVQLAREGLSVRI